MDGGIWSSDLSGGTIQVLQTKKLPLAEQLGGVRGDLVQKYYTEFVTVLLTPPLKAESIPGYYVSLRLYAMSR